MKKRSLWILFISALLCLSMLLAACDSGETVDTEGPSEKEPVEDIETNTETENEEIPEDEKVNYVAILSEWGKYLTSVGDENNSIFTSATHLFTENHSESTDVSVTRYGKIAKAVKTTYAIYDEETGKMTSAQTVETVFYNFETGAKINGACRRGYIYDFEINGYVSRYNTTIYGDAIIEIADIKRTNLGTDEEPDWQMVTTYSYYDNGGNVLASDLGVDDRAEYVNDFTGLHCLKIADKAYHMRDGEIILVGDSNNTYAIPDFDVEYNGYRYSLTSDKIQVINDRYELVVNYSVPSYLDLSASSTILANGDVYIFAILNCDENSTSYDFIEQDNKYDIIHLVVSIKTGEATEIDAPFVVSKLISNYDTEETGIKLNGDYQYAEITRINDKTCDKDKKFVILDNALAQVVALPRILKNQTSVVEGKGNGDLIIKVANIENDTVNYTANLDSGNVSRFLGEDYYDWSDNLTYIDGGFVREYFDNYSERCVKVYNNNLDVVCDLTYVDDYEIRENHVYFVKTEEINTSENDAEYPVEPPVEVDEEYDPDLEEEAKTHETVCYVGYIGNDGNFKSVAIGKDANVNYMMTYNYRYVGLYTVQTEESLRIYNEHGYEIKLGDANNTTNVVVIAEYEGCIVLQTTHPEPTIENEYAVVYKYYIIK